MLEGDIGFQRSTRTMGRLVLLGTWLKFRKAFFTHQFAIDRIEGGVVYVIQAQTKGVTNSMTLDELKTRGPVTIISPPPEVDIEKFLTFCRAQIGDKYGFLTDFGMAIDILTWQWFPSVRGSRTDSWQCSALINEGLRFGGWLHDWQDIYAILPDEGYDALTGGSNVKLATKHD